MSPDDLLRALEAHGQKFLQSFESVPALGKRKQAVLQGVERDRKKAKVTKDSEREKSELHEHEEEEWAGFGNSDDDNEDSALQGSDDATGDEKDCAYLTISLCPYLTCFEQCRRR